MASDNAYISKYSGADIDKLLDEVKKPDNTPLKNSKHLVTSGGVYGVTQPIQESVQSLQERMVLISNTAYKTLEDNKKVDPAKIYMVYDDEE